MCKEYDILDDDLKSLFDDANAVLENASLEEQISVIRALEAHVQLEAFVQVPYQGPKEMPIRPSGT